MIGARTRDITAIAITTALLICVQFVLSMIAGVEMVTIIFVTFCICYGAKNGVKTAIAFSLLRCILFGTIISVLVLYLVYFTLVALFFGNMAKTWVTKYPFIIIFAMLSTILFTMLDNIISPLIYSVPFKPYFIASIPIMITQIINVAISFAIFFLPIRKVMQLANK